MKHLITILITLFSMTASSQITFEKMYQFSNYEYARGEFVAQTHDSGYFVAGRADILGDTGRINLLKTNAVGDTLWTKTFGRYKDSFFNSAALTSDSGIIIIGCNTFPQGPDYYKELYIIKCDKNGDTLWTLSDSTIGSNGNLIQQTFDDGYILTATNDSGGNRDIMLIRMDAIGNILWKTISPSPHVEDASFLIQTSDSGFAVSGYQYSSAGDSTQAMVLKTTANGTQIWKEYYSNSSHDNTDGLIQTSDGNLVTVIDEKIDSTNLDDVLLLKIDITDGSIVWTNRLGNSIEDENPHHLSICNDGGFFVIGTTEDTSSEYLFIIKTNPIGDTIWTRRINYAVGEWAQETRDDGFIITGDDNGNSPYNFLYLLKLDSAGNFSTSISEIENSNSFILYPNPATTSITILSNIKHVITKVEIYNMLGEKVFTGDFYEQVSLNCELFPKGIYLVQLNADEKRSIQKLIIQ